MENLKRIIQDLKNLRTDEKLKVSDEVLFENAVDIFISNRISESRKEEAEKKQQIPATKKQIETLKNINADFNEKTITKKEAYDLLKKLLSK